MFLLYLSLLALDLVEQLKLQIRKGFSEAILLFVVKFSCLNTYFNDPYESLLILETNAFFAFSRLIYIEF